MSTSPPSCKNCGDTLYQQGDPNDGGAEWKHETTRSIRCELYAEPADGREFETEEHPWQAS